MCIVSQLIHEEIMKRLVNPRLVLSAVLALAFNTRLPSHSAQAQLGAWLSPVQLSETGRYSWFPDIVADKTGRVHVVWSSSDNRYDIVMYTTLLDVGWSLPTDIAAVRQPNVGESAATRPAMFVDGHGKLHLTYTDYSEIYYSSASSSDAQSPAAWSDPQVMNPESSTYFSRMTMDSRGVMHLIYTQNVYSDDCRICFNVFHRSSGDGGNTWTPPVNISATRAGSAKPQIIVDRNDNLHVVWESGPTGGTLGGVREPTNVMYSASYDGGKTWTTPLEFTSSALDAQAKNPAIAEDGDGQLLVVWRGVPEEVVYSQISRDSGKSWSAPQPIPQVFTSASVYGGGLDTYSLASDSAGNVHLVLVGVADPAQPVLSVLHVVWNGQAWSGPTPIVTYANGDVPEWPRIAVGLGNQLHVVWFTRDRENVFRSESPTADYRVWYSSAVADAPAVAPIVYPTPIPRVQPTKVFVAQSVLPTREPVASQPSQVSKDALRTEMDEVGQLLLSLLPAVGLILIAWLLLRRRSG